MKKILIIYSFFLPGMIAFLIGCGSASETAEEESERLARTYCGSCHQYPSPERLDKLTWYNRVLPRMAIRMGLTTNKDLFANIQEIQELKEAGVYPVEPLIDSLDWLKISDFYLANAPDSLPDPPETRKARPGLPMFRLRAVDLGLEGGGLTTMLSWDQNREVLFAGDGRNQLFQLDAEGQVMDIFHFNSPPVDMYIDSTEGAYVLSIGHVRPSNSPRGRLNYLDPDGNITTLIDNLPRPVDMAFSDLDGDGKQDFVLCGFGHFTGRLSWYRQSGEKEFEERVLIDAPGAIKTYILDFNGDERPDILTLMAQGDERIVVHYNEGGGKFREENLLRFDPVFGSAFFEPMDFDGDGDLDLLYTNGDNADFSFCLKPYHGIRLFENKGDNTFEERFFFPLHGAFKTSVADFDMDGDPDIAAIAFFPDYDSRPGESFLYLENISDEEGYRFQPHTMEAAASGRWLIMESADFNGDGRSDIALGSFTYSPTPTPTSLRRQWVDSRLNVLLMFGVSEVN